MLNLWDLYNFLPVSFEDILKNLPISFQINLSVVYYIRTMMLLPRIVNSTNQQTTREKKGPIQISLKSNVVVFFYDLSNFRRSPIKSIFERRVYIDGRVSTALRCACIWLPQRMMQHLPKHWLAHSYFCWMSRIRQFFIDFHFFSHKGIRNTDSKERDHKTIEWELSLFLRNIQEMRIFVYFIYYCI